MPDDPSFADRVDAAADLMALHGAPEVEAASAPPEASEPAPDALVTLPDGTAVPLAEIAEAYRRREEVERQREALAYDRERVSALHAALNEAGDPELLVLSRRPAEAWQQLASADPARYMAEVAALDAGLRQRAMLQAAFAAEQEQGRAARIAAESARLSEKLPEWQDPKQRGALAQELRAFLKAEGFDKKQIDDLVDHRTLLVVRKAMLWDRMQADAASGRAKQVPVQATPTVRPVPVGEQGGRTRAQRLVERARSSGRRDDRVAALEALLT